MECEQGYECTNQQQPSVSITHPLTSFKPQIIPSVVSSASEVKQDVTVKQMAQQQHDSRRNG